MGNLSSNLCKLLGNKKKERKKKEKREKRTWVVPSSGGWGKIYPARTRVALLWVVASGHHPRLGLGPGHVPSIGLAERASWRSMMIWDRLLPAPPLLQKLGVEGDSGAGGVSPSVARGCTGVGSGKVARWSVRAPTSAVKNSLAGCHFRAAGGESFSTWPKTSILHDPRGIPNRSENGWRSRPGYHAPPP